MMNDRIRRGDVHDTDSGLRKGNVHYSIGVERRGEEIIGADHIVNKIGRRLSIAVYLL